MLKSLPGSFHFSADWYWATNFGIKEMISNLTINLILYCYDQESLIKVAGTKKDEKTEA